MGAWCGQTMQQLHRERGPPYSTQTPRERRELEQWQWGKRGRREERITKAEGNP